jgi:transposase
MTTMGKNQRAIYAAEDWQVQDGTASDGSGRPSYHRTGIRRVFAPEYKLSILAEYDRCTESGEKGALLRREGLYSSLLTDWRRQHRQGLLKAAMGRSDQGRGGPTMSEMNKLKTENERLRLKLAQAEAIIEVQGKVHALLEEITESAKTDDD